ncbi:MAG: TonB-dependent receptor [Melioribacteraceae bacterium]|nr:TonB-dependent receptor [Melioribacteraceae bacterium]
MNKNSYRVVTKITVLSFLVLTLLITEIVGQTKTGIISGEVRDATTQQPLPGANVIILNTDIGAACDESGYYVIKNVSPGSYILKVSMIGYESATYADLIVNPNRNHSANFKLHISVTEMDEVQVSADHFAKPVENPVSFRTISPEEIRRSPGSAEDIFRVMQSMPGVATAGTKSAQLIVRGGSPEENLTLLDNIEVYNPIHFARTGESMGVISIVNPALIQKVDFLTGGFPAKYGDKMSSVFDMTLKEGNRETMNTDVNLNIAGFGVTMDGPLTDNANMIFSLRRGYFDLITSLLDKPVAPNYYDAVGKISFDLNKDNRISLVGFYYIDQIERTGIEKGETYSWNRFNYLTRDDYGSAIGINWRSLISEKAFSLVTASYTSNGWNTIQGTELERDLLGEDIREDEFSLRSEFNYQFSSKLNLKLGGQFKVINSHNESWSPADTTRDGTITPANTISYQPDAEFKSMFFLQSSFRVVDPLLISVGLRYDYFSLTNEINFSPRISLSYNLSERARLNFAWGRYYQTPANYEVAPDERNLSLNSSYADHYIAGLEYRLGLDTKVGIEIYHKELSNLIVDPDSSNLLINTGSGYAQGVEFSLQKKFTDGFVGSASYSYSISKRRDYESTALYDFEYDRPHILNLIFGLEIGSGWQIGAKFQYASGNPYTPVTGVTKINNIFYVINGESNSARYPNYHKLDLRIDKQFVFDSWSFSVYLDLWNVYNRDNVVSYSFKTAKDGTVTTEPRYDFGIMPIIGFTAKF